MKREQEFLCNIYWKKIDREWKIIREAVFVRENQQVTAQNRNDSGFNEVRILSTIVYPFK